MKLKSELTWSFSRDRLFKDCKRAYFYNYYASWGGWDKSAEDFAKKAYLLKNVRNVDAWIGDIVHQIIKWILENKKNSIDVSLDSARKQAKQLLMKTYEQSHKKMWKKNIKYNLNLFEHYYGIELTRQDLAVKLSKVTKSLNNFYKHGINSSFADLKKESFLSIDQLDSFLFDGIKVFAIPDFALKKDKYVLYDWKTGKPSEKDRLQLSFYILYAMQKWNLNLEDIDISAVYLIQDDVSFLPIEPVDMKTVKEYITESIIKMKNLLSDVENNKADISNFDRTDQDWRCKNCKFKEICLV